MGVPVDWDPATTAPTAWTDQTLTGTLWTPSDGTTSLGIILLESDSYILLEDGSNTLGLE